MQTVDQFNGVEENVIQKWIPKELVNKMRQMLFEGWAMPKKYDYPDDLPNFEVAHLTYAAAAELNTDNVSKDLWKPVVSKMYKELIFSVATFTELSNDTYIHTWQMSPDLITKMRQLIREGWTAPPKKF